MIRGCDKQAVTEKKKKNKCETYCGKNSFYALKTIGAVKIRKNCTSTVKSNLQMKFSIASLL